MGFVFVIKVTTMNFTADDIRAMMLNNKDQIDRLRISDLERSMFNYIDGFECVHAVEIAKRFNISIQNASTRLKRLFDKGYLVRVELSSPTGGVEYQYHTRGFKR
jgi:DNA-binding MarR family transcriptional regulator